MIRYFTCAKWRQMLWVIFKLKSEVRNDTDWNSVVDENRRSDIFNPEKGPLWKCIFLPNAIMNNDTEEDLSHYNCVVIFIQDHSINDGVGTVEMMKNFMFVLNQLLSENEVVTNLSPPELPLEYFLHQKYPISSFQTGLKLFLQTLISFRCVGSCMIWMMSKLTKNVFGQLVGLEEDRNPYCTKSTISHLQILTREKTKTLVQSCKNNGCTVQGAIQAASNVALLHILHEHGAKLPIKLVNYVPIDMRRRILENPTGYPGTVYAGGVNTELEVEKGVLEPDIKCLWKLARNSTNTVRAEIEQKQYLRDILTCILCPSCSKGTLILRRNFQQLGERLLLFYWLLAAWEDFRFQNRVRISPNQVDSSLASQRLQAVPSLQHTLLPLTTNCPFLTLITHMSLVNLFQCNIVVNFEKSWSIC